MNDLEFKIRTMFAKGRNIVYYRLIDTRERAIYMHVLREYRKSLVELIQEIPKENRERDFFIKLINIIKSKVTPEECDETILKMKELYEREV